MSVEQALMLLDPGEKGGVYFSYVGSEYINGKGAVVLYIHYRQRACPRKQYIAPPDLRLPWS